jgi:peptidoglycan/xylan/chitin deacetylase (PgdA/CDA1 family)
MDERHAWVGNTIRRTGGGRVLHALQPRDNVRVTMTHAVADKDFAQFDAILRLLARRRRLITPHEFFQRFADGDGAHVEGEELLVTFDDGLRSAYEAAIQVLAPLGIKAMFFIPTAILELRSTEAMRRFSAERVHFGRRDPSRLLSHEYLFVGKEELVELHTQGHMILPHTHSHARCSEIRSRSVAERELQEPKRIVERLVGEPADGFALPVGTERDVGRYSFAYLRDVYRLCFTALAGTNGAASDRFLIRRDSIHPWFSLEHAANIVDGLYDPWYGAKARRQRRRALGRARPAHHAASVVDASDARARFVVRIARLFEKADIKYVVLHGAAGSGVVDSDVDIAVDRDSLDLAHAVIEGGALGRVLQCFRYAGARSRYYVLETHEPGRRYRQLDLVCDPWGIGCDGPAVGLALANAEQRDGIRVPTPAAETVYLAVKRARKRMFAPRDQDRLLESFRADPDGAHELLVSRFGGEGDELAQALAAERDLTDALELLRRRLRRLRCRPAALVRRPALACARIARRLVRPTGLLVFVVGPDGAGKSELAAGLEQAAAGAFRRFSHFHFRPHLVPPPSHILQREHIPGDGPHARSPSASLGSLVRLAYLCVDTVLAAVPKLYLPRVRSTLIVVERGWLDLAVDRKRYRISLPQRTIGSALRLLPRPNLILHLDAPADVICSRTVELERTEVERQLGAWRALAAAHPDRFVTLDAAAPREHVLASALAALDERLALRQSGAGSYSLAVRCLGTLRRGGKPYRVARGREGPRWLLPARHNAPGPLGAGLYRPASVHHVAAAVTIELAQRLGIGWLGPQVSVDVAEGLAHRIAEALHCDRVELAAAVTGDVRRGERVLLSVRRGRRIVAFAKVAKEQRAKLEHEFAVLRLLADCRLECLVVPEAIDCFAWHDSAVLLLRPFHIEARADRPTTIAELGGLAELGRLAEPLSAALGVQLGLIPLHGDFAPWNSDPLNGRNLLLWDWEQAGLGLPLQDLFHWRLQRLWRLGHGSVDELVGGAFQPDEQVRWLSRDLGIVPEEVAPHALRASLESALERIPSAQVPKQALAALTGG